MKQLIKIDRKSIKLNPKVETGQFVDIVSSPPTCIITIFYNSTELPKKWNIEKYCHLISCKKTSDSKAEFKLISNTDDIPKGLEKILRNIPPQDWSYEIKYDCERIYELGCPSKYLFKYIKTKIRCKYCKAKFYPEELKEEDYDDDTFVSDICPKCGEPDCCNFMYEQLNDEQLEEVIRNK